MRRARGEPVFRRAVPTFVDTAIDRPPTTEQHFWTSAARASTCRGTGGQRALRANTDSSRPAPRRVARYRATPKTLMILSATVRPWGDHLNHDGRGRS